MEKITNSEIYIALLHLYEAFDRMLKEEIILNSKKKRSRSYVIVESTGNMHQNNINYGRSTKLQSDYFTVNYVEAVSLISLFMNNY